MHGSDAAQGFLSVEAALHLELLLELELLLVALFALVALALATGEPALAVILVALCSEAGCQ